MFYLTLILALIKRQNWMYDQVTLLHGISWKLWQLFVSTKGKPIPSPLTLSHLLVKQEIVFVVGNRKYLGDVWREKIFTLFATLQVNLAILPSDTVTLLNNHN